VSEHTHTKTPPRRRRAPTEVAGHRLVRPLEGSHATWEVPTQDPTRIELLVLGRARKGQERAARTAFERQLRERGSLLHPHLATIVDGGESPRGPFVVVSLPRSRPLSSLIAEGPLDPERTHTLLTGVADALDAAHTRWLIHTDLTPRAIFVEAPARDWAWLTDFGIAHNRPPLAFARAGYRSPEELRGEAPLPESNVYSLACIVYTCLSGSAPFARQSSRAAMQAQLEQDPPKLLEARPELPRAIDDVLERALAKKPDKRQKSAGELIAEVGNALGIAPKSGEGSGRNGTGRFRRQRTRPVPVRAQRLEPVSVAPVAVAADTRTRGAHAPAARPAARPKPGAPRAAPRPATETQPQRKRPPRDLAAPPVVLWTILSLAVVGAGVGGWMVGGSGGETAAEPAGRAVGARAERAPAARTEAAASQEEQRVEWLQSADDAVERLNERRAAHRRALARAATPGEQSWRAGKLAGSYARARQALAGAPESVPSAAAAVAAFRRAERAYVDLSRSAGRANRDGYRRSVARVRAAERAVERALGRLGEPA
jgi:hypothetical protein